ncbi:HAD family hydrolase [Anaerocolumna sp.]|uniref:HAD family hydrolase n=1 Tax=Anaerocolumna sp. TaxID=2041569 RepID=UPI0028AC1D38|nr:HAD family phosphatase [Anaerocolumna sp.]
MIKTIILDIGQVMAHFRWREYLTDCGYDKEKIDRVSKATVLSKEWGEEDRGILSDEELINAFISNDPSVAKEIRQLKGSPEKLVQEYDYSADFVKKLKANGHKVYLLSNYGKTNFAYAKSSFKFIPYVDGGIISYEVKHIKPEPEIYQALIDKYQFDPKEAVFLDDSLANLEGAKAFGFHTIHFTEYDKAVEELKILGVNI